jgi:quercetin dioxygenase-like cupin family protein
MSQIIKIDPTGIAIDIRKDMSVTTREAPRGAPERMNGMTMGILTMTENAPHNGELHPDGDEIIYVISGSLMVRGESAPDDPVTVKAGELCIVPKGEWHKVELLEETQIIHLTPGPNGDHRPLPS